MCRAIWASIFWRILMGMSMNVIERGSHSISEPTWGRMTSFLWFWLIWWFQSSLSTALNMSSMQAAIGATKCFVDQDLLWSFSLISLKHALIDLWYSYTLINSVSLKLIILRIIVLLAIVIHYSESTSNWPCPSDCFRSRSLKHLSGLYIFSSFDY